MKRLGGGSKWVCVYIVIIVRYTSRPAIDGYYPRNVGLKTRFATFGFDNENKKNKENHVWQRTKAITIWTGIMYL